MNQPVAALLCPKCGGEMRTYERNGVTVDQCTGCRGIFLDRGELERLIDAEGTFYASTPGSAVPPAVPTRADEGYRGHGGGGGHGYDKHGKRRRGFLGELFD